MSSAQAPPRRFERLELGACTEIILEAPPARHSLHVDLSQRVSGLGLPTEAVAAT